MIKRITRLNSIGLIKWIYSIRQFKFVSCTIILSVIGLLLFISQQSCITIPNQYKGFPPGIWRGMIYIYENRELIVTEGRKEEISRDVNYESRSKFIPFNFEIQYDSLSKPKMIVRNGSERIVFDDITIGRNIRTGEDTFRINLLPYDTYFKGIFQQNKMRGYFVVQDKKDYYMVFEAKYGQDHRFNKIPKESRTKVNGIYQAVFADTSADRFDAIGEFTQVNQKVTGTFRTETGDFRYLEGEVDGNRLLLSCFDGSHVFLFEADIKGDSLNGMYYSGRHYKTNWKAIKVTQGALINPDSLTKVKQNNQVFKFLFTTPDQKTIDFSKPEFRNKIKIVQIMGSWCPNCRDESSFLNQYIKEHPNPDLIIVGLSFERYPEKEKAMERIKNFKSSLKLNYDIAYGGRSNKDSASAVLPQLSGILAYPTMLFVDRNNIITKVHTGFDGPATSEFQNFKKEFTNTVQTLLQKK